MGVSDEPGRLHVLKLNSVTSFMLDVRYTEQSRLDELKSLGLAQIAELGSGLHA